MELAKVRGQRGRKNGIRGCKVMAGRGKARTGKISFPWARSQESVSWEAVIPFFSAMKVKVSTSFKFFGKFSSLTVTSQDY